MNEKGERPRTPEGQPAQDRRLFGVLMLFAVVALFFGIFQTINAIRGPFQPTKKTSTNQQLGATGSLISSLKQKDTDGDGLSDFDELYTYQTSPYLADSDSDGISDSQEIANGTDPNCAQGTTCSPLETATSNTNTGTNTNIPYVNGVVTTNQPTNTVVVNTTGLSVSDLRTALKNAGAPAATIDGLSDDELLALYQEITGSSATLNGNAVPSTNVAPTNGTNTGVTNSTNRATNTTVNQSTLANLTPSQIRDFLVAGGADASVLSQVDDATLQSIFQQALSDMNQNP